MGLNAIALGSKIGKLKWWVLIYELIVSKPIIIFMYINKFQRSFTKSQINFLKMTKTTSSFFVCVKCYIIKTIHQICTTHPSVVTKIYKHFILDKKFKMVVTMIQRYMHVCPIYQDGCNNDLCMFINIYFLPYMLYLTNPICLASSLQNFLAVKHSSLTKLSFPTIFGNLCRVPTSAANPTSTSCNRHKIDLKNLYVQYNY